MILPPTAMPIAPSPSLPAPSAKSPTHIAAGGMRTNRLSSRASSVSWPVERSAARADIGERKSGIRGGRWPSARACARARWMQVRRFFQSNGCPRNRATTVSVSAARWARSSIGVARDGTARRGGDAPGEGRLQPGRIVESLFAREDGGMEGVGQRIALHLGEQPLRLADAIDRDPPVAALRAQGGAVQLPIGLQVGLADDLAGRLVDLGHPHADTRSLIGGL